MNQKLSDNLVKKIAFIAGEESGDQHAAKLLAAIQKKIPDVQAYGLGGKHLQALGMDSLMDLTTLAITGVSGVLGHLSSIKKAFSLIQKKLLLSPPDLVILVDYPGFNLRMAKWINKHLKCPILYYISPQIWAWKEGRIETIKRCVSHMAVILPFEKAIYEKAKVPVSYVGHPLSEELAKVPSKQVCRDDLGLDEDQKILAILPGSRNMEITRHMPVICEALKQLKAKNLEFEIVIPVAQSLNMAVFNPYLKAIPFPYQLIQGQAQRVIKASDAVVVASGTASLECAVLGKPSCIIYKSSWFNYYLARRWMKVKYLGLCNLLMNRMVCPELLQMDCNPKELGKMISLLLNDSELKVKMEYDLQALNQHLVRSKDEKLEDTVLSLLAQNQPA